jgi:malonyl-CoA/methylmalonyl-CoA synthetase
MNLNHLFRLTFEARADQPAIEFNDIALTFAEVAARAARTAATLQARGLKAGDRLCVYLTNRIEVIDLYLACLELGAIYVPINILYKEREAGHIVRDADPVAVVTDSAFPAQAPQLWQIEHLSREAAQAAPVDHSPALDGDTPAAIIYTSGTTGAAKGAVLTHNNLATNAINLNHCWRITDTDRLLLPLPLFHVHGLGNGIHCWLQSGCHLRLLERFDNKTIAAHFDNYKPTVFFGVPTMYVRLLEVDQPTAERIGASMRLFVSGSAPLPPQTLEDFRSKYNHTILERYGMSETLMNISNPYAGERRPGTVGLPLPGVSVRIDETGELYLKGPNVFAGYWRNEKATSDAFDQNGFFRTGDIAERSEDGYYTLKGRRSDLIISGGFNIYPREIEEFLLEQEEVSEAAVAAIPDATRGEVPVAYVVCTKDLDTNQLEARCRAALASFKVPRAFIRLDSLPRTALGKIQKHLLPRPEETAK